MEAEEAGDLGKRGEVELETNGKAKASAFSCGSRARSKEELHMGGKLGGQKLRDTAFGTNQNVRLLVADKSRRCALRRTMCSLAPCDC